ncbi:MAG: trimethylamine corrinoid protein 2 [Oligosphaeraceae bacterium]|nr:trimethylamine corrinoid protein 2 [Oligosphaeraceae bacterium]
MFSMKPDFAAVLERFEAWWQAGIIDRPLYSLSLPVPPEKRVPVPRKSFACPRERWLDSDYVVAAAEARLANTIFLGDSLPVVFPNLGPDVFAACYGCELEFAESTSWSRPILKDLSEESLSGLVFDQHSEPFLKLVEITEALLQAGRGRFIVGYTDLHPGGDAAAALRGPQELLLDTIDRPEAVKKLVGRLTDDFFRCYDFFQRRLQAAGMPGTSWLPAVARGKYHIPSNDFSCMVSENMFEELFLPDIIRECRYMDHSIYHLDGPQALRFLDRLLDIPAIQAIQWVPGAGREGWRRSIAVYQRIQSRKKAFQIQPVPAADLDELFSLLAPEGAWISHISGISTIEEAEAVRQKICSWTRRR